MPGISNTDMELEMLAKKAEELNKTSVAICTSSWHLPVHKQSISFTVSSTREASAIEEYIMKLANLDISYDIDTTMLSDILGLDETFTEEALSHLCSKDILDTKAFPVLKLTENGKILLDKGLVPDKEQNEEVSYYINLKTGHVYAKPTESNDFPLHPDFMRIEKGVENIKKYINRKFLTDACQIANNPVISADSNAAITSIVSAKTGDAVNTLFTEILMFDIANRKCFIKVWDHACACFRDDITKMFEKLGVKSTYSFEINENEKFASELDEAIKNTNCELCICRGEDKLNSLYNCINSAQEHIVIYTPDLSYIKNCNISDTLQKKVKSGVKINIYSKKNTDTCVIGDFEKDYVNFEIKQMDDCSIFAVTSDYGTVYISGIEYVKCYGDFSMCENTAFCITDKEFAQKLFSYQEQSHF